MSDRNSAPVAAHSQPAEAGTPSNLQCYCGKSGCPTPGDCRREWAGSETGWREIADRRPRWNLADGTAA